MFNSLQFFYAYFERDSLLHLFSFTFSLKNFSWLLIMKNYYMFFFKWQFIKFFVWKIMTLIWINYFAFKRFSKLFLITYVLPGLRTSFSRVLWIIYGRCSGRVCKCWGTKFILSHEKGTQFCNFFSFLCQLRIKISNFERILFPLSASLLELLVFFIIFFCETLI